MAKTTGGRGSSRGGDSERGQMTAEQKRKATLRKMEKDAINYATMGGRGPKKGSPEYEKRLAKWKASLAPTKKAFSDFAAAQKAERTMTPKGSMPRKKAMTKPAKQSTPKSTSRGGGRRSSRDY